MSKKTVELSGDECNILLDALELLRDHDGEPKEHRLMAQGLYGVLSKANSADLIDLVIAENE